jgi:hypothetical protein
MLIASLGDGSNAAGEFHHPIEITFESRKGQTGFYTGLYFPEKYHKSVVDLGPVPTLDEAIMTVNIAAGGNYTYLLREIYASYGVTSVREIFRDVYSPLRGHSAKWVILPDRALIARFEQEVKVAPAEAK